jgi:hypothetical protein
MTTNKNYTDTIFTPTFEISDVTCQCINHFERQAIIERVEIDRKLREDARLARLEIVDPYEGMYGVTCRADSRNKTERNILPQRRGEATKE